MYVYGQEMGRPFANDVYPENSFAIPMEERD